MARIISDLGGTFQSIFQIKPGATSGAPGSGKHRKGDLYMDADAVVWRCTAGGTPGTWAALASGGSLPGPNGSSIDSNFDTELVTIAAAVTTYSVGNIVAGDAYVYGLVARVVTVIPGPTTSLQVGMGNDKNRFISTLNVAAGSTGSSFKNTPPLAPFNNSTATQVRFTAVGGAPGAGTGQVRVVIFRVLMTEPTS